MGQLIGTADLEIGADLAPLDADLAKAKAKSLKAVAEMQAIFDRLHIGVHQRGGLLGATLDQKLSAPLANLGSGATDMAAEWVAALETVRAAQDETAASIAHTAEVATAASEVEVAAAHRVTAAYLEQAAAARAAGAASDASVGRALGADVVSLASRGRSGSSGRGGLSAAELAALSALGIEGVRGKSHPGSRMDPLTVVVEAARYTNLGGMAAMVGENGIGGPSAPPVRPVAAAPAKDTTVASTTDRRNQAAQDLALANAVAALDRAIKPPTAGPKASGVVLPGQPQHQGGTVILPAGVQSKGGEKAIPVIVTGQDSKSTSATGDAVASALAAEAAKQRMPGQYAPSSPLDVAALGALGMSTARSPSGAMRVYGIGGQPGTHNYGVSPLATAAGTAAGGGGGGLPPWLGALLWGRSGGGGGRAGGLLTAGGALAGLGSIGSFAGFGPEHIALTAGGIVGSGVSALAGGALLGAGAAGKAGVGLGSDSIVMSSTIADTKKLGSAYEHLNLMVKVYGKNSEKAREASKELDVVMAELGNTAGVKAELGVAMAAKALNKFWDQQTSGARVQASKILMQVVELGKAYVPLVAKAAEQNFSITNRTIKPLFEWLKGPEGMGIFLQLEQEFKNEIPTAMKALDMGFQFFAKTVAYTAPLTGAFLKLLDNFFTKWNQPGQFSVWEGEMNRLIGDFHTWGAFIKILGRDLFALFSNDAHTGQGIIEVLTQMLVRLHEWETSTQGRKAISNIFLVHKEEIIALLKLLPPLVSGFSGIYTTVAPPLVKAVTGIAEAFGWLLNTLDKAGPLTRWALGLTLIAAKLKLLGPLLTAARGELGLLSAAEAKNAAVSGGDATATAGLVGAETAAGSTAYTRAVAASEGSDAMASAGILGVAGGKTGLLSKGTLVKGGLAAGAGLLGGSLVAGATGAKGTLGTSITAAGAGAGAGFVAGGEIGSLGGPLGAALGASLGFAAPYAVKFLSDLFSSHAPDYGKRFAQGFLAPFGALLGPEVGDPYAKALEDAQNKALGARKNLTQTQEAPHVAYGKAGGSIGPTPGATAAAAAQLVNAEHHLGEVAAKAFIEGQQHVQHPTRSVLTSSMQESLEKLAPTARMAAAKSMLAYATELESKGVLAKGAVASMIHSLESQFPGLASYLAQQGTGLASQFAKALELKQAQAALAGSLDKISQLFGTSNADTISNAETTMHELAFVIAHSQGPLKSAAEAAFSELKNALENQWILAKAVNREQIAKINSEFQTEIKVLGSAGFSKEAVKSLSTGKESTNFKENPTPFGHAGGGLLQIGRPGDAGHDTVPLNVGGMPIAVAPGEQVAVFNRHQLPIVNDALAGMGGLQGLFSQVSTPNYMASGGIIAPHVGGSGEIPAVVRAGLSDVAKAANAKVSRVSATSPGSYNGSGGKGSGGSPSANERLGREMMVAAGFSAGEWPYLQKLWTQESGWNANSVNSSSGAYGIPQALGHGHPYNLGDARAQIAWGLNYIKGRYGSPSGAWAHEVANNWYGRGGLLGFAKGGLLGLAKGGSVPKRPKQLPKDQTWKVHPFGKIPPVKTSWWGQGFWEKLNGMMGEGGPIASLAERYTLEETADEIALSKAPHEGAFVVTPNALEKAAGTTLPYEDPGNVALRSGQLGSLRGTEGGILSDLTEAWNWSGQVLRSAEEGIAERNKAIAELKARIRKNLELIKKCRETIKRQEAELKKLPTGKHSTAASRAQAKKLKDSIASEHAQIKSLEAENVRWGGSATEIGSGGNIGKLSGEVSNLSEAQKSTEGWMREIGGASGQGGKRVEAQDTLAKLGKQLEELGATPEKLKEAILEAGGGPESPLELSEREKTQLEEKLKISREETKINAQALSVFGGPGDIGTGSTDAFAAAASRGLFLGGVTLPYGGSFATGGVIPGPIGAPTAIVAHGGETVTPVGGDEPRVHFEQHNHMLHPSDPSVLTAIGKASVRGIGYQGNRRSSRVKLSI